MAARICDFIKSFTKKAKCRRKFARYSGDVEIKLGDHVCRVHDWSFDGICFATPTGAAIKIGEEIATEIIFYFLLEDTIIVQQEARVIRTSPASTALEFLPLSMKSWRDFERVLDCLQAEKCFESQTG